MDARDETLRYVLWACSVLVFVFVFVSLFGNPFLKSAGMYQTSSAQAQYVGASVNLQWQNSMEWARNNTQKSDIFIHWWDYGYFVQTLADRPTVTDGGHAGGGNTDHYIGRYVLTTPQPETAFSFMKTWDVSYLLIDPTEMGKYGAFSKIGSNDSWDRVSAGIFGGAADDTQEQETVNGTTKVYQLGGCVDADITYSNIFLPGISVSKTQSLVCNSYIIGVILNFDLNTKNEMTIGQPIGVFIYNNKQYRIPLQHIFVDGEMISFESGIDSVVYLIPEVDTTTGKIDNTGAMIYLSPRTFNSLMGRLYILNDYYNEYPTLTKAHFEDDPAVAYFKQFTGGVMNEFIYYQGIRAPLKIWNVEYPTNTEAHEEFFNSTFMFGGMDKYL